MNSMTREMKDSGIAWVGNMPKEWETVPAKSMFMQRNDKGNKYVLQLLSPTQKFGVIPQSLYEEKTGQNAVKLDEKTNLSDLKTVHKGDYCISLRSFQGGFELSDYEGVVSPAYQVFYPIKAISQRYYKHLFKTQRFIDEMNSYTMSLRDGKNIAFADFGKSYIPVPPLSEQKRIGNYLDFKCSQIDRLSDNIKQQIEELGEYKKALITQAVTKGLDPDVEMKDSGIEWIETIPMGWNLVKHKYFTSKIGSGKTPRGGAETYTDKGPLFIRSQNVYDTGLITQGISHITPEVEATMLSTRVRHNDLLLNITGGSIGRCAIYKLNNVIANVNQHVSIIRINSFPVLPEYLHYFWISNYGSLVIGLAQKGTDREGMPAEAIKEVPVPLPPYEEQKNIANYLDSKCSKIDSIIKTKNELLKTIQDYKKSLIYDYVTGKREVPTLYRKDGCHE